MTPQEELDGPDSISEGDLEFFRDALEFPHELDDSIQRPLSSRSVVRTPSSKYRDKTIIKTLDDVTPQPQVLEEGVNEVSYDVDKTNTSGPSELPKEEDLPDQRSISSQICVSPSWSRAADKKRRKKDQERQEQDQRDLERKLEHESKKHHSGTSRREPRKLTKRPPPASSSRASSANSRMQRPSTASSFRSFWSNRSSRDSSVQGSDTEGRKRLSFLDSLKKGQKGGGAWRPRMWSKKFKAKATVPQRGHVSDSEAQPENAPRHSLHTVKKHGDLRSIARSHSNEDADDQNSSPVVQAKKPSHSSEGFPEDHDGKTDARERILQGRLYQPGNGQPAQKGQGQRSPPFRGVVIGPSSSKKRSARAPIANNIESPGPISPSRIPFASSFKSPVAETRRDDIGSASMDQSFFVKIPKTPSHDFDRSRENAGQTPKKGDQVSLQPRSPNISKKINRNPDFGVSPKADAKKPRELFEVVDLPRDNDPVTESNNQPGIHDKPTTEAQGSSCTSDTAVIVDGMPAASSYSNNYDNKPKTTVNFSRTARLRPSPLSGPPLFSPEPKVSATSNDDTDPIRAGIALQPMLTPPTGQGRQLVAESIPARTRQLSLDRFLRPGRAKKAAINEIDTPSAKQAVLDYNAGTTNSTTGPGKGHSEAQTSTNVASQSDGKSKAIDSAQEGALSLGNGEQKLVANDGSTARPRRNSIDIINKLRPSPGKTEAKLRKKRPNSAEVNSISTSTEKPLSSHASNPVALKFPLPSPENTNPGHPSSPASISALRSMKEEGNSYFTKPAGKPWLGSDQISSSSSLLGFSSVSPSSSRGNRPTNSGQRIAKMFVICCKCKFWHDMPSDAYAKLAFPTVAALKNKLITGPTQSPRHSEEDGGAGWPSFSEPSSPLPNKMDDEPRASTNLTGTGNHGSRQSTSEMNSGKISPPPAFSRFSFLNQSVIKCCWCEHRMSRTCCAGWTALVQLRERHH
ncbi:hypothetical protein TESG_07962 [Trichophyton tonsurans CBS 112818]|uniref:Uncharacterized protein n=1 Tax=Trichophyton tonsurans (strain CBS 112818) TaxID=647933 RepID=F2SAR5_TRIT1|nr:hypothetical protein TESG_07962 [Trichophyton tonsurans CBS 112818]